MASEMKASHGLRLQSQRPPFRPGPTAERQPHARQAMENFFKESTLVALRELAIRQTAHEVDVRSRSRTKRRPLGLEAKTMTRFHLRGHGRPTESSFSSPKTHLQRR